MNKHAAAAWLNSIEATVDQILQRVQGEIVMAIPLGLGKPNPLVNALYRRIAASPERRLKLFTALSLEKPQGKSSLEAHFLEPLVERVFGDYPDMDYVKALRAGTLPPNIEVHEFFMKTGDYLGNDGAQQAFVCTNYSFAVRDMMSHGVNVLAQAVASRTGADGRTEFSLSCNPDLSFDLIERMQAQGRPLLAVAMVNHELPFMPGNAVASPDLFGLVLDGPGCSHTIFAPPNAAISWADYAIGLHAASLVPDGGTLQIGIGSLGDAIAQALIVRDGNSEHFKTILSPLCHGELQGRELDKFEQGLYGCSEMFVNGFMRLIEAGLIRRRVFSDLDLQELALQGRMPAKPSLQVLQDLLQRGRISSPLREADLAFLSRHGILKAGVNCSADQLQLGEQSIRNDLRDPAALAAIEACLLGPSWLGATIMHGGFFLGPRDFYQRLREMPEEQLALIDMTRIGFINELYGDSLGSEALKRAQRVKARLMNTTMKVTLLGAASSDGMESGQMVSGVGGQYNFVAMGHALPDARGILMLRSTHDNADGLRSNIVWSYANCTIPRHLRDIVITEYGVADLRGCTDSECVKRLLNIADSRFQTALLHEAIAHGKLEADYEIPAAAQRNSPEMLREHLRPWRNSGVLPDFPFGTDLTADELTIVRALKKLKHASHHPLELVGMILQSLSGEKPVPPAYLERLGLADAKSFKDLFVRRLFASNL
ncbi:acetyl-CoA hydrolase/transferase C-terminal domain-containing protein [Roseateles albus]|uniref:Acetyl-CoA hydrolase/transferase C-terminal domain-containing protein n=1 Tax=Roseateles albus TaxID=2987525 RepID=A0ABT5KGS5_9BURK|nr:acetyl-CoA hydrolase/transferase C-terminal domain-containing protein [Roseateles albus]MDC8773133.1 acetyl-CoA hydrolase/transferase C-terminal domain-containing protein [Roseateles albus]